MPTYEYENVVVRFSDNLAGMSASGLLQNAWSFHVKLFPGGKGELFSLLSPDYQIQLLIEDGVVVLRRNGYEARREIGEVKRHFQVLISWRPDKTQLALIVDDDAGNDDACVTVSTPPIYVPMSLLDWARRFNLIQRTTYSSPADFLAAFLESVRQAALRIRDTNAHSLFWDRQRIKAAQRPLIPKREPEAMSGIAAFLQDQSLLAGYQILKESQAGAGSLDIRVVAPLANGGLANICVEGKNAHSPDLEHGVKDQLPAYMHSTNANYGVYLVLWYQCDRFPEPRESKLDITWRLTKLRPWETIVVETIELAFPKPPSDRSYKFV